MTAVVVDDKHIQQREHHIHAEKLQQPQERLETELIMPELDQVRLGERDTADSNLPKL